MKSYQITKTILELSEEERLWLHDLMQNPINYSQDDEDPKDNEMRERFWDATSQ